MNKDDHNAKMFLDTRCYVAFILGLLTHEPLTIMVGV